MQNMQPRRQNAKPARIHFAANMGPTQQNAGSGTQTQYFQAKQTACTFGVGLAKHANGLTAAKSSA